MRLGCAQKGSAIDAKGKIIIPDFGGKFCWANQNDTADPVVREFPDVAEQNQPLKRSKVKVQVTKRPSSHHLRLRAKLERHDKEADGKRERMVL